MEAFAQYGLVGLAIGAVVVAIRFAEHVYDVRKGGNGNGKLVCPNRIDDLWPAIRSLDSSVRRTERASSAAEAGIKQLLDGHMTTLVELQTRSTKALENLVNMQSKDHG